MSLFDRLRYLFDWHVPPDAERATARKPIDSQTLPGPRWKAQTFTSFMQAQGTGFLQRNARRSLSVFAARAGRWTFSILRRPARRWRVVSSWEQGCHWQGR